MSTASPDAGFLFRAAATGHSAMAAARPWREFLDPFSFALPSSLSDAIARFRHNSLRFGANYTIVALLVLFLSLLYHPIAMIVFLAVFAAWLFLYFSRDEPFVVLNRTVDDRVVLVALGVSTIVALLLARVWLNVLVSVVIGTVVVSLHATFRVTDDFGPVDEESPYGAMLSVDDSSRGDYSHF